MSSRPPLTPVRGGALGSSLSIATKGLLIIAIPALCQLGVLGLLRQVQASGAEAERWAVHSKDVLTNADEVYRQVVQAVASQRGAAIAGRADFEGDLRPVEGAISRRLEALAALVNDSPSQAQRVARLRTVGTQLEAWISSQYALVGSGRATEASERIMAGDGRDMLARFDREMTAFLAEERRLDDERVARVRVVNERARLMTALGAGVSLIVAGALAYVFSRGISARIGVVTANAARLAAGEALASPVPGSDEIAQLDAVLRDTSQRLAAVSAAEQGARLELEQRADELHEVNRELATQTQENELFIYSVSHDLRSPLVNLQGFSRELTRSCDDLRTLIADPALPGDLRTRAATLTDQDIPESVHFIRTAVSRASAIIDALLRLSRVGRVEYQWQLVAVAPIVTTVLDAMRATINERRAAITVRPLAPVWGDPIAVEQIFANLIGNAVNYLDPTRPGQIHVGMLPESETVTTADGTLNTDGHRVYFVEDNGLGIPAISVPKVFVAFQRLHAQRARGEGIGLAVVRRIVDRLRGRIWVESTEGVGSTFFVMLPTQENDSGRRDG
jgi:signal transduction histidine kinase